MGNKTLTMDMSPNDDVATLISLLKRMEGVIPTNTDFTLHFAGRKMEMKHTLEYYWIQQDSRVQLDFQTPENAPNTTVSQTCTCF
jgi:hypothetical protein